MDAAAAARMSDPERNTHFRRLWREPAADVVLATPCSVAGNVGTLGIALIKAWRHRQHLLDVDTGPMPSAGTTRR